MVSMLAVLFWPVVVFWLFATRKPAQALAASILGGYLFLPENYAIDLPAVPSLDKNSIAGLAAVLASAIFLKGPAIRDLPEGMVMPGIVPGSRAVRILLAVLLIGMAGTVVSNGDPVSYGPRWLPGLRHTTTGTGISRRVPSPRTQKEGLRLGSKSTQAQTAHKCRVAPPLRSTIYVAI